MTDEQQPSAKIGDRTAAEMTTNSLPDEELMLHVRNGVGEMLGVLFDRHHAALFNFYCKMTADRNVSEDLVQDVFYRILKYRKSYQPGTSFRTWMYQIARNARLDQLRKRHPGAEVEFEMEMSPKITPTDVVQQEQETALLHRALMQLPEEKREVLLLSRFQELKYEEIAKLLGCEVGAVKVRVFRTLQELRQIFHRLQASPSGSNKIGSSLGVKL